MICIRRPARVVGVPKTVASVIGEIASDLTLFANTANMENK